MNYSAVDFMNHYDGYKFPNCVGQYIDEGGEFLSVSVHLMPSGYLGGILIFKDNSKIIFDNQRVRAFDASGEFSVNF